MLTSSTLRPRASSTPCGPASTSSPSTLRPISAAPSCHRSSRNRPVLAAAASDGPSTSSPVAIALSGILAASAILGSASPSYALDDQVVSRAVSEYVEQQGKFDKNIKALEDFRQKYKLKRAADGRLLLKGSRGDWFQIRLDMEVAGSMLLRDPKGNVFAIQTDALQQIDLSDDLVALMMFADGDWEKQMSPVEYIDEQGSTKQLQLEEKEFREVVGILKEMQEEDEPAMSK